MLSKKTLVGTGIIVAAALVILAVFQVYETEYIREVNARLTSLEASTTVLAQNVASIQSNTQRLATTTQAEISTLQASARKQAAAGKSEDQLIMSAVSAVTPAVVSIVISEEVPNLQVTYVNPFGNDPNFQNFGIQVPVYEQSGSTLQKIGAGSGFLVSHDGYIVTNKHVVSDTNAEYTVLLSNGSQKTATVVYRDPTYDLAVVKIAGIYPTIVTLGDSSALSLGQSVIAIGNALGQYNNSVSTGIISGLNRTIQAADPETGASEQLTGIIQTDAAINPGNSGGPLADLSGDVIGINVATIVGSSNIAFAIPVNTVKNIVESIVQ